MLDDRGPIVVSWDDPETNDRHYSTRLLDDDGSIVELDAGTFQPDAEPGDEPARHAEALDRAARAELFAAAFVRSLGLDPEVSP